MLALALTALTAQPITITKRCSDTYHLRCDYPIRRIIPVEARHRYCVFEQIEDNEALVLMRTSEPVQVAVHVGPVVERVYFVWLK